MKNLPIYVTTLLILFVVGCSKQNEKQPAQNKKELTKSQAAIKYLSDFQKEHYDVLNSSSDMYSVKSSKKAFSLSKNMDYRSWSDKLASIIDPDDYDCESTDWREYVLSIRDWDSDETAVFNDWGWLIWDYNFVFANKTVKGETYGIDGDFTNDINRHFRGLTKFWDIDTDIALASGKASFWKDKAKVLEILTLENELFWGSAFTDGALDTLRDNLVTAFGSDGFEDYTHPFLSLNAFAATPFVLPDFTTSHKIVMGDGIMDTYDAIELGDVAPAAILAHEYGHQIQFANDIYFDFTPEGTRGTELMADALAAYYLTHKRGATMNWKRVQKFLKVFFNIGDCSFSNPNHHGTPDQRMRAAKWGYDMAQAEKKKGQPSSSADFIAAFEDAVDDIISDDE